ncbi:MAG: hypothetical protein OEM82_00460 [Acidobacteriota bacterium]|nr:hypothetical protein [Acidobacteriota bacterium]MDH3529632.1 hypothetical protein [Acidobacteriota bacterium]
MNGQKLLNTTLRVNALFSLLSGIDLVVFDSTIVRVLTDDMLVSILPTGVMLIAFSIFVFSVSMLSNVNKYLVGSIIAMDALWVLGSLALVLSGHEILTFIGQVSVLAVALVIASFAFFQTKGLLRHLQSA